MYMDFALKDYVLVDDGTSFQLADQPEERPSVLADVRKCWSFCRNFRDLVSAPAGRTGPLDGVRAIAVYWVVLLHAYLNFPSDGLNGTALDDLGARGYFRIVQNGSYGVDMFFVLSGFLMHQILSKAFSTRTFSIWRFYRDRWLRLFPAYIVVLALFWISQEALRGPAASNCRRTVWANLLFVNNFVQYGSQCMYWSWTIAVEFQFYLVSPLVSYALWRKPKAGRWLCGIVIALSTLLNVALLLVLAVVVQDFSSYADWIYLKPYTRLSPYIFGMLAAHHADSNKVETPEGAWPRRLRRLRIATCLAVVVGVAFGASSPSSSDPPAVQFAFAVLGRQLFSGALSYLIYVMVLGPTGPVSRVLSSRPIYILAQLSYGIYLIHPVLMETITDNLLAVPLAKLLPVNLGSVLLLFATYAFVATLLSVALFLLVEKPFMNVRRVFDKRPRSEPITVSSLDRRWTALP
eukprot:TRINITY_DN28328_c0_g1_i1.p1 TRINITY_DN28328_c0_g1~~TRINITY_DN28328_c0_g1_i1.p1  ORF type:complete len:463 (+),score=119.57 TRINITY_DN28328_c0_g1_i1:77-1465(+)